ncbi:MAG: hypothetical protein MHM6MM_001616 [Cercozoa sp. M6MM]
MVQEKGTWLYGVIFAVSASAVQVHFPRHSEFNCEIEKNSHRLAPVGSNTDYPSRHPRRTGATGQSAQ